MNRRSITKICLALVCVPIALQVGAQTSSQLDGVGGPDAQSVVSSLYAAVVAAAGLPTVAERFSALQEPIAATHDLEYIGRLTVRRAWRDFSDEQRELFIEKFARLSTLTWAARFVDVSAENFRVDGSEALSGERSQVRSAVLRADGSEVPINFVMAQGDAQSWRIINVIADGVSDLALRRAEYTALLEDGGFAALSAELDAQIEKLMSEEAVSG